MTARELPESTPTGRDRDLVERLAESERRVGQLEALLTEEARIRAVQEHALLVRQRQLELRLRAIYSSRGWKILEGLRRIPLMGRISKAPREERII